MCLLHGVQGAPTTSAPLHACVAGALHPCSNARARAQGRGPGDFLGKGQKILPDKFRQDTFSNHDKNEKHRTCFAFWLKYNPGMGKAPPKPLSEHANVLVNRIIRTVVDCAVHEDALSRVAAHLRLQKANGLMITEDYSS